MKINKQAVFYHVLIVTISNIILQLVGFVYRIFLSRSIGPEGMGIFQLIFPVYSIVISITLSGLCMAISRISAERHALNDKWGIYRLIRMTVQLFILLFIITAIPTALFSGQIAKLFLGDIRTQTALLLLLPCLLFTGFENIFKSCFYGVKAIKPPLVAEFLEQFVRFGAVAFLLLTFKPTSPGTATALIVFGMVISEIASSLCLTIYYKKRMARPQNQSIKIKTKTILKNIVLIALPVSAASLANSLLSSANILLLPRRLIVSGMPLKESLETFGILFGMVMPLIMLPCTLIFSLSTILVPKLSAGIALKNLSDVRRKISKALHVTGLLGFPAIAIMIPLAPTICLLLYKQNVVASYITPLVLSSIFIYYQVITGSILNGIGMQKRAAIYIVISGVIQLLFTYFAVGNPRFGIYGFFAGYLVSSILIVALNIKCIINKSKLKIKWLNWFFSPILSASISSFVIHFIFRWLLISNTTTGIAVIISIICGLITYNLILRIQGTDIIRYLKTLIPHTKIK